MKPTSDQITEAVRYIESNGTGARPELEALVEKIERFLRNTCSIVKVNQLPEIAEALQFEVGGFDFILLGDIDEALFYLDDKYSMPQLAEIVLLERHWSTRDPIRIAAVYDKYGSDLCAYAMKKEIRFQEFEAFDRHFAITEELLAELTKLPLKMPQIVSLLEDGIPVEKVISLTNDLRRNGLRGLSDRVRAAAEGHPKPLLDGAI